MEESRDDADDIVYEILLRLPVKILKRFQCVCKSWSSLISSPQFQKNHFRRAQQNSPCLLTLNGEGNNLEFSTYNSNEGILTPVSSFSKTVLEDYFKFLMQSCLGLVCIFHSLENRPILVCNPSMEELISLPYTSQRSFCVGFGYATSTQEFKVVRFFSEGDKSCCQVCTLGISRHWREVKNPPYFVSRGTAPFLHGALHFLPHIDPPGVRETDYIAVFDIDAEEYKEGIPFPKYYHSLGDCKGRGIADKGNFIRLTKLRGSLCLTFDFGDWKGYLELWLLEDYKSAKWVKGYTIDIPAVFHYNSFSFRAYPSDTMGGDILLNCSNALGLRVLSYDPHDGIVKVMHGNIWVATFYVESFYHLGGQDRSVSGECGCIL